MTACRSTPSAGAVRKSISAAIKRPGGASLRDQIGTRASCRHSGHSTERPSYRASIWSLHEQPPQRNLTSNARTPAGRTPIASANSGATLIGAGTGTTWEHSGHSTSESSADPSERTDPHIAQKKVTLAIGQEA